MSLPRLRVLPEPRLRREVALIALFYGAYTSIRMVLPQDKTAAYTHAGQVLSVERRLGLDVELGLNGALLGVPKLAALANLFYATAHFAVTLGVLVWVYRSHPLQYRRLRSALMIATGVALIGFWLYPLAPPRFLPAQGFVDPVAALGGPGLYSTPGADDLTNQFAAMPSMHAGWALWCAVVVGTLAVRPAIRWAAWLYPVVTVLVIMSTANHYLLDVIAGVGLILAALALSSWLYGPRHPGVTMPARLPARTHARN